MDSYCLLIVLGFVAQAAAHGRFIEPPSRASAWRFGFDTPVNWDDNELNCGGIGNQIKNGYKCGICGDPYQGPRRHEAGGKFATGTIVRHYPKNGLMQVKVDLTKNHYGWMEFRLCPNNDVTKPATEECLNRYLLEQTNGQTRYEVKDKNERDISLLLKLPKDLTCSQCVVQWKYHAGNTWGFDPETGEDCRGCGYQEEFYGCADIAIH